MDFENRPADMVAGCDDQKAVEVIVTGPLGGFVGVADRAGSPAAERDALCQREDRDSCWRCRMCCSVTCGPTPRSGAGARIRPAEA